ncbi:MAG: hypothetical protein A4E64_00019 [Syntrophorhabdus sp. PtaU1.Bin058]|nr:MAG: hypothetical protein A4E64_00019 [Syntrophorhabdus sp. PtaU1.Bin058]
MTPTLPGLWIYPAITPILHFPGEMIPGVLGPMSFTSFPFMYCFTAIISRVGMPSVRQTMRPTLASTASMIASAAKAGGTKIAETLAPADTTAARIVLKTGTPLNI